MLNFIYSEKATQFEKYPTFIWHYLVENVKKTWEIFSNLCGLLGIYELYEKK